MHRSEIIQLLHLLRERDLSSAEWHRLQSYAEGDQFVLDALEGLRQLEPSSRQRHLQSILNKIHLQTQAKRKSLPIWVRAAAAIALIVTVGIMLFNLPQKEQKTFAAIPSDATITAEGSSAMDTMKDFYAYSEQPHVTMHSQSEPSGISRITDPGAFNPVPKVSEPPVIADAVVEEAEMSEIKNEAPAGSIAGNTEMSSRERMATSVDAIIQPGTEVRGVVMNMTGERLNGAQIQLKGTLVQAITDDMGNFTLDIPSSKDVNPVVISYAGYSPLQTNVAEGDSIIVRLETQQEKNATVTTLAQKSRAVSKPATRALAMPVLGERSYNKYLRQNLKYPEAAADARVHGKVVVEFDIDAQGRPVNLRIVRSLGYGCDEEAMRLIREGPAWNAKDAQVAIGRWEVNF